MRKKHLASLSHFMLKPFIFLFVMSGFFVFSTTSCSKYEDGPLISLRTKKARLSNHWQIDAIEVNGIPRPDLLDKYSIEIKRRGEFTWLESSIERSGMWAFDQNNENVILVFSINDVVTESKLWEIRRLANAELWVTEFYTDSIVDIEFVPLD